MWAPIILGAIALLLTMWAAHVGFSATSTNEQRDFAWKVIRLVWPTAAATAGLAVGVTKLYESGLLNHWPGIPPP